MHRSYFYGCVLRFVFAFGESSATRQGAIIWEYRFSCASNGVGAALVPLTILPRTGSQVNAEKIPSFQLILHSHTRRAQWRK